MNFDDLQLLSDSDDDHHASDTSSSSEEESDSFEDDDEEYQDQIVGSQEEQEEMNSLFSKLEDMSKSFNPAKKQVDLLEFKSINKLGDFYRSQDITFGHPQKQIVVAPGKKGTLNDMAFFSYFKEDQHDTAGVAAVQK